MRFLATVTAAAIAAVFPLAARADTTIDLQNNFSGFTSPGNVVGPWRIWTMQITHEGTRDTPGLSLINRVDEDAPAPQHMNGIVVDDYHNWTPRFFTYVALQAASNGIQPNRGVYLEGDQKFGPFVLGGALTTQVYPNQTVLNQAGFGPTYYWPKVNVTVRYMPGWLNPGGYIGTYLLAVTEGLDKRATTTLTLQAGAQPPSNNPGLLGIDLGVTYAHVTRPSDASLIYIQRGLTLGTFTTFK
jgi:YaiO family outer membrane protein